MLAFSVAEETDVRLVVFDVSGAAVRTVINGRRKPGVYREQWDGRNDKGSPVASGVYFYRLTAGSFRDARKMVLIR